MARHPPCWAKLKSVRSCDPPVKARSKAHNKTQQITFWGARLFLRPFSNKRASQKKKELTLKNRNFRKIKNMHFQFFRGHVGSGSSIRSIHGLHSIPLHCIAFHRSIPLHSTALHSIIIHTPRSSSYHSGHASPQIKRKITRNFNCCFKFLFCPAPHWAPLGPSGVCMMMECNAVECNGMDRWNAVEWNAMDAFWSF